MAYLTRLLGSLQGELQYFIGVQLDGSEYVESETKRLSEKTEKDGSKVVGLHFHPSSYRLLWKSSSLGIPTPLPLQC